MASIGSLTGSTSSSSSIYGNRTYNIISGLASGMDTEELISGVVQSYQQKIQSLQKKNTKLQWQQEGIQSISDKLVKFDRNYSSYVYSGTNLMSPSFFSNAVTTTTNGTYASLVSASGKTSNTVVINAVRNLASAARYTCSANHLSGSSGGKVTGSPVSDLTSQLDLSKLSGSLTLNYGSRTVSIDFGERELFVKTDKSGKEVFDADAFQSAIEQKLKDQKISTSSGTLVSADTLIGVDVDDAGRVSFFDKSSAGNSVSIAGATGNLQEMIPDLDAVTSAKAGTFQLDLSSGVTEKKATAEYLSGKTLTVTLDGKSQSITLPEVEAVPNDIGGAETAKKFAEALNASLEKAFGSGRISVSTKDGALSFQTDEGSTLSVTAASEDIGDVLGIGTGLTTYLDTTKTLSQLQGIDWDALPKTALKGTGAITQKKDENGAPMTDSSGQSLYVDADGNSVDADGNRLDEDGNIIYSYDLEINGVKIGSYTKDTELNTVINNINSNTEAGVSVSYSKTAGQFVFTAKDTGTGGRVEIASSGLAAQLFGSTLDEQGQLRTDLGEAYSKGEDAIIDVSINGQDVTLTRSSNSFDLDGMNVTVSGTFTAANDAEKVTFTSKTDTDTIVDAVKKMVEDLNAIIKEVKSAYSDMPLQQSDGSAYKPLTDDDMADMSDSAIEAYEEKAKTGILFMDKDLSSLYNDLRNAITCSGADGVTLRSIGIETAYSDGLTTLTLNEQTLREALESDPDKVQEAFTKSKDAGAATDGLMATLKSVTDRYAAITGDVKGILIEKAGSQYSPSAALDNTLLNQMKGVEEEISKWQGKMSDKVDYYTNKFTQLEVLINEMNSQSSALSGLLGG